MKNRGPIPLWKIEFTTAKVDFVILLDDFKLASGLFFLNKQPPKDTSTGNLPYKSFFKSTETV